MCGICISISSLEFDHENRSNVQVWPFYIHTQNRFHISKIQIALILGISEFQKVNRIEKRAE